MVPGDPKDECDDGPPLALSIVGWRRRQRKRQFRLPAFCGRSDRIVMRTAQSATNTSRRHDLKQRLVDRRGGLIDEVRTMIRDARANNIKEHVVLDDGECSEADI